MRRKPHGSFAGGLSFTGVIAFLAMAALARADCSDIPGNLVQNCDFDTNLTGWTRVIGDSMVWSSQGYGAPGSMVGNAKYTPGFPYEFEVNSPCFTVFASTTYNFSGWVLDPFAPGALTRCVLRFRDSDLPNCGWQYESGASPLVSLDTADWHQLSGTATTLASAVSARLTLNCSSGFNSDFWVYLDDAFAAEGVVSTATSTAMTTPTLTPTQTLTQTPTSTSRPTDTPTAAVPSPTPSPTPTFYLSGTILHYNNANPVAAVSVDGQLTFGGPVLMSVTTDAGGAFAMGGVPAGGWALQARLSDTRTSILRGVSSLDATWIQEYQVGIRSFGDKQLLAADSTGNGSVSTLDATRIQEWRVGTIPRLPVASNCQSDWAFVPVPGPQGNPTPIAPHITAPCTLGGISYDALTGSAGGQDFQAVLFGDVTGNWTPPSGASEAMESIAGGGAAEANSLESASVSLPSPPACAGPCAALVGDPADPANVVIGVSQLEDVQAFDLTVDLPEGVTVTAVEQAELAAAAGDCSLVWAAKGGVLRISLACLTPIRGGGALLAVELRPVANNGPIAHLSACVLDEGESPCRLR